MTNCLLGKKCSVEFCRDQIRAVCLFARKCSFLPCLSMLLIFNPKMFCLHSCKKKRCPETICEMQNLPQLVTPLVKLCKMPWIRLQSTQLGFAVLLVTAVLTFLPIPPTPNIRSFSIKPFSHNILLKIKKHLPHLKESETNVLSCFTHFEVLQRELGLSVVSCLYFRKNLTSLIIF